MKVSISRKRIQRLLFRLDSVLEKCGGPGSGIPGPCALSSTQNKHVQHIEAAAKLARGKGYTTEVNHSNTTSSSYLALGERVGERGFKTHFIIRISDHKKPGFRNGYDAKSKTLRIDTKDGAKALEFVKGLPVREGKGQVLSWDETGRSSFKDD